eukprot:gene27014-biopygen17582
MFSIEYVNVMRNSAHRAGLTGVDEVAMLK